MIQLILSMTLWGTLGVFVLWSGLPAIDVAFYRCLFGAILVGCWLIKSREKIPLTKPTILTALAGVFLVLNWVFLFESFQISTITIGNMSYYLQPIILLILGMILYKSPVTPRQWMLTLLAVSGVILTIDINNLYSLHIKLGVFYAILAAVFYSFVILIMQRVHLRYVPVMFIQLTVGSLMLLPFIHIQALSMTAILCLSTIAIVHTLGVYALYYNAIKKTTLVQIAIVSYLDPIVAIATDVIFFNRHLSPLQLCGVGLTFMALYMLVTLSRSTVEAVPAV